MLAAAMLITVFPFSAAAEEGEDKKDITIQWGQVTQESSDKAAVTLSAGLSADSEVQSATVNIKLTEEEKSALTTPLPDGFELESWQEETVESDGDDTTTVIESAPEGIPAAGGEGSVSNNGNTTSELPATTAAQPTDYRLSFKLTQGVPITNVTVLTVAEDITIEITDADIEITDATYTEGQKNTAPSFKMEPSPFEFSLPEQEEEPKDEGSEKEEGNGQNGQDTSQQGDDDTKEEEPEKEDEQVLPGDNGSPDEQVIVSVDEGSGSLIVDENSLDDFSFSIQGLSVPTEEHTPNTYAITLTLPKGVSLLAGELSADGTTIKANDTTTVATFTLDVDSQNGATVTLSKPEYNEDTNTLTFALTVAKAAEETTGDGIIEQVVNAVVRTLSGNESRGVTGTLKFPGEAFNVDYGTLFGGPDPDTDIKLSVNGEEQFAVVTLTEPMVEEDENITPTRGDITQTVHWRDNGEEQRHNPFVNGANYPDNLTFTITKVDAEDNQVGEAETVTKPLTNETLKLVGLDTWPTIKSADNTGFTIELPTQLMKTVTSAAGDGESEPIETITYYRVDWTLEPPEVAGYALQVVGDEWYYIKTEQFTLNLDLKDDNNGYPSEEQVAAILSHFSLYGSSESEETEVLGFEFKFTDETAERTGEVTLGSEENAPKFTVTYSYNKDNGEFTINGLPSYTLSGNADPITYWVQKTDVTEATEEEDAAYQISAEDLGDAATTVGLDKYTEEDKEADLAPDYLKIEYLNTNLANYGDITSEVYSGGTLRLTRVGETTYQAVKVWLDNSESDKNSRPDAVYDLWRYTTEEASQVRNESGQFISATYSVDEEGNATGLDEVADTENEYGDYDAYYIRFKGNDEIIVLDKYDQEGRKYTYGVRETLGEDNKGRYEQVLAQVTTQVTAEEPEEGEVAGDGQDSSTTLTEITDWYIDTKPDGTTEKGETEEKANEWRSEELDASTQDLVFNGGVLSNRLTGQVQARVTKTWDAAAFQSDLLDVAVEFTLYQRKVAEEEETAEDWVAAENANGDSVTYIMYGFRAENMTSTYSTSMPQYDAEGNELEYMWVETTVYEQKSGEPISDLFIDSEKPDDKLTQEQIKQELEDAAEAENATVTKTELNTDGALDNDSSDPFTLGHKTTSEDGDDTVEYESISSYEDNKTTITNRIADTIEYAVEKVWKNENGVVVPWPSGEGDPDSVTMHIYRIPSGSSMTESGKANLYVSVTIGKDGKVVFADDSPIKDNNVEGITVVTGINATDSHFKEDNEGETAHDAPEPDINGSNETNGWDAIIQGLPKYDVNGHLYTYILVEGEAGEYHPDYQTEYYSDGCYSTIVTNGEGGGQRIMVEKVWMDGGDDLHREPVTLEVRWKSNGGEGDNLHQAGERVEGVSGDTTLTRDNGWYGYITLPEGVDPENVYVVEVSVGENEQTEPYKVTHYTGVTNNDGTPETAESPTYDNLYGGSGTGGDGYGRVETSHHRYEVTYAYTSAEANPLNEHLFTITNRRLGNVDMTVTKEWTAGTEDELTELLDAIRIELKEIADGTELALALWLDFDVLEGERPKGWKITRNVPTADKTGGTGNEDAGMPSEGTTPVFDTVSIGGRAPSTIYKTLDGDGKTYSNPTTSVQILLNADTQTEDLQGAPKEYTFYGLPKYDSNGEVVKYDVEEAWVKVEAVGNETVYKEVNIEDYPQLNDLWKEFSQIRTQDDYTAASENDLYNHDKQVIGINNARTGTKDVTWYKEWRDAYTEGQNQRPDIYLDIYAVKTVGGKDGKTQQQIEVVQQNYRWSVLGEDAGDDTVTTYADNGIMTFSDTIELLNADGEEVNATLTFSNDQWSVKLNDVPKYDNYGNEIQYYAVERTVVHASDYDYQAVQYAAGVEDGIDIPSEGNKGEIIGNRDGPLTSGSGTGNKAFTQNTLNLSNADYQWADGSTKPGNIGKFNGEGGNTYPQYALLEDGTFINTLANTYTITGQKLWEGLDGYLDADSAALPTVIFNVYQYYQDDNIDSDANNAQLDVSKKVAWLTVESEDWKHLRANENSSVFNFKIEYLGATTISETEGSQECDEDWPYENQEQKQLPLYDENGRRYVYVVQEVFDFVDDADSSASTEPSAGDSTGGQSDDPDTTEPSYDHVYEVEVPNNQAANIVFTNTYEPDLGALKVKKILSLPANADSEGGGFPDLTFTLTRKYMVGDDLVEDTVYNNTSETSRSVTLTGTTIASAFETADKQDGNDVVLTFDDNIIFKDLPIYAPNGSKYVYTVTETGGLGGYDTYTKRGNYIVSSNIVNINDFTSHTATTEDPNPAVTGLYPEQVLDNEGDPVENPTDEQIADLDPQATFYNERQEKQDDTVILTGTKVWEDYGDAMGTRPPFPESPVTNSDGDPLGLTVTRTSASGKEDKTLTLGEDYTITYTEGEDKNSWTFEIKGMSNGELQKFATDGDEWTYTVTESLGKDSPYTSSNKTWSASASTVDGDRKVTLQGNVTNSIYTDVPFEKRWEDENGNEIKEDYLNGLKLTVTFQLQVKSEGTNWTDADEYFTSKQLSGDTLSKLKAQIKMNNGTVSEDFTATLSDTVTGTNWTGKFENLPKVIKVNGGKPIDLEYRVVETSVAYGDDNTTQTFGQGTADSEGDFNYTVTEPGEDIEGLVTEAEYEKEGNVTTNTLNTIELTVQKNWVNDSNNMYHTRPGTSSADAQWDIWLVVQRTTDTPAEENATWTNVKVVHLTGGDNDNSKSETIKGLPVADFPNGGVDYTYRVRELKPKSDNAAYTLDELDQMDKDNTLEGALVNHNSIFAETGRYDYTATYEPPAGTANVDDSEKSATVTVTNELVVAPPEGGVQSVHVEKKWYNEDGTSQTPQNASVKLVLQQKVGQDGEWKDVDVEPIILNGEPWTGVWDELPTSSDGNPVYYRVEESEVEPTGYVLIDTTLSYSDNGQTVTYTFTNVATTEFEVEKSWIGISNPNVEVKVGLYRTTTAENVGGTDGEKVFDANNNQLVAELTSSNLKHTFEDLPKYNEEGALYLYYALELDADGDPVADNGSITLTDAGDFHVDYDHSADDAISTDPQSTTITNTPSTSLSGTKTWKDNNDAYDTRPDEETFKANLELYRTTDEDLDENNVWEGPLDLDEQGIGLTIADSDSDVWTYTFTNLPLYDDGENPYTYKVEEVVPNGYKVDSDGKGGVAADSDSDDILEGPNFTNTLTGEVSISGTKTWQGADYSNPILSLERRLAGTDDDWKTVDAEYAWGITSGSSWTYSFKGTFPLYDDAQQKYEYRVREDDVERDYDVYYDDDNRGITNVQRGSLRVSKEVTGRRGNHSYAFGFSVTFTLPTDFDTGLNGTPTINWTKSDGESGIGIFENGTAIVSFRLSDDETIMFTELPGNTTYTVTETDSNRHDSSATGDVGMIPPGDMAQAEFNNYRGGGGGDTPDPDEPDPEIPDEPTPGEDIPPDEPDTPDEPDNPDDPGTDIPDEPTPGEDVPPDEPGTDIPDEPTPGGDVPPDDPNTPDQPGKPGLPQTGQLWWPVLLLAAVGAVMSLVGLWNIKRYRGKHGKNKV